MTEEFFTIFGQSKTPGSASQQLPADLLFKSPDLMTDRRLSKVQPLSARVNPPVSLTATKARRSPGSKSMIAI
jgi:hypothetical protein